jgi:ABC-type multidrug transport system ATPase subunit
MRPPGGAIEIRGVRCAFHGRPVLRDVTLSLSPGSLVGLVGENGAGKTTLLRILAGLLEPDAGSISAQGRLGYCPQEPALFEALTVREHFRLFADALGIADWTTVAQPWIDRLRLGPSMHTLVGVASGGTRQKLNLALALLARPDVLLLDEPYAAFDWETYLEFWTIVAEARARGAAVLLVSHLVHDRERLDRVCSLSDGVLRCG